MGAKSFDLSHFIATSKAVPKAFHQTFGEFQNMYRIFHASYQIRLTGYLSVI
jgi:hypothetical protein